MPVLDVLSGNQLQAVSGRRGRPVLGDLLLAARADLPAQRAFQQRERELTLQEEEQRLQEQAQRDAAAAVQRVAEQRLRRIVCVHASYLQRSRSLVVCASAIVSWSRHAR